MLLFNPINLVCLRIEIKFGQVNENEKGLFSPEWTLGSCYGPKLEDEKNPFNPGIIPYGENELHYDRCCLLPGRHTLTCSNEKSELGWRNVTFEINGKRYCDDFVGFKAMRTIFIEGRKCVSTI